DLGACPQRQRGHPQRCRGFSELARSSLESPCACRLAASKERLEPSKVESALPKSSYELSDVGGRRFLRKTEQSAFNVQLQTLRGGLCAENFHRNQTSLALCTASFPAQLAEPIAQSMLPHAQLLGALRLRQARRLRELHGLLPKLSTSLLSFHEQHCLNRRPPTLGIPLQTD